MQGRGHYYNFSLIKALCWRVQSWCDTWEQFWWSPDFINMWCNFSIQISKDKDMTTHNHRSWVCMSGSLWKHALHVFTSDTSSATLGRIAASIGCHIPLTYFMMGSTQTYSTKLCHMLDRGNVQAPGPLPRRWWIRLGLESQLTVCLLTQLISFH